MLQRDLTITQRSHCTTMVMQAFFFFILLLLSTRASLASSFSSSARNSRSQYQFKPSSSRKGAFIPAKTFQIVKNNVRINSNKIRYNGSKRNVNQPTNGEFIDKFSPDNIIKSSQHKQAKNKLFGMFRDTQSTRRVHTGLFSHEFHHQDNKSSKQTTQFGGNGENVGGNISNRNMLSLLATSYRELDTPIKNQDSHLPDTTKTTSSSSKANAYLESIIKKNQDSPKTEEPKPNPSSSSASSSVSNNVYGNAFKSIPSPLGSNASTKASTTNNMTLTKNKSKLNAVAITASVGAVTDNRKDTIVTEMTPSILKSKPKPILSIAASKEALTAEAIEAGWNTRGKGTAFRRTVEIWGLAFNFILKEISVRKLMKGNDKMKAANPSMSEEVLAAMNMEVKTKRRANAKYLKEILLKLGPTFIKFGQLLSTRVDILPKEYTEELKELQDNVPGFAYETVREIIQEELGAPLEDLYTDFQETPLAAASLGQVHLAIDKLTGKKVAVKIQRQGLKELFDLDLKNLKYLAIILDKFDPKTDGASRDWVRIYEESAKLLYREIDYKLEGINAERFAENFKDTPWVKVPSIYWGLSTEKVLTMEYVPGIKVSNIEEIEKAGIDRELLSRRSAESYLTQICRHGFFHCDPHPGNLACDAQAGGRLIYYDFGMMDELQVNVKKGLVDVIFSVYDNDPKGVCDGLETMNILRRGVDRISVEKIARFFLNSFKETLSNKDGKWANQMSKEEQNKIKRQRRAQLGNDLFSVSNDLPFSFPPTFTFVFRAFTTLDGIGKGLDPKYDLTRLARPFLKELIDLRDGSATLSLVKGWQKKLGWRAEDIESLVTQPRRVRAVSDILTRAEQGDLKLRVRVLESERAFQRMDLINSSIIAKAVLAILCLNTSLFLQASNTASVATSALIASTTGAAAVGGSWWSKLLYKLFLGGAMLFGFQIPIGFLKLKSFDKKSEDLGFSGIKA